MDVTQSSAVEADFRLQSFGFDCGARLDELRLHYRTLGSPTVGEDGEVDNAVLLVHGTGCGGDQFLQPAVADFLFRSGQPLDTEKYYVILPDAIGHGHSSKPSDGMRAKFPEYAYGVVVSAQNLLVTEHLGIKQLRLVAGTSMGECTPGCGASAIRTRCAP